VRILEVVTKVTLFSLNQLVLFTTPEDYCTDGTLHCSCSQSLASCGHLLLGMSDSSLSDFSW
jgi:hypothetical protein